MLSIRVFSRELNYPSVFLISSSGSLYMFRLRLGQSFSLNLQVQARSSSKIKNDHCRYQCQIFSTSSNFYSSSSVSSVSRPQTQAHNLQATSSPGLPPVAATEAGKLQLGLFHHLIMSGFEQRITKTRYPM